MSEAVRIVDAYWDRFLAVEPVFATAVGDSRFDDVLPDPSEDGRAERHRVHAALLQAAAGVDAVGLDAEERRTLALAVALARRELACDDPAEAVAALQGRPGGQLGSREEILALALDQVSRSWNALPRWFGRLPARNCAVAPVDAAHEDDLGDYYLAGTTERAGTYFVNTRAPRPAYDLAATSFHEANPGHHLQTALELEAAGRHALRRNASELQGAAHVEGWGLYSERLADEMGLYANDVERLGMLSLQALRSARLVVDTGIHAFGWTRERSIATLRASGCDQWLAAGETDRYSAIPGQALTYKLGQLELEGLREQWVARGGDVRGFHDTLLGLGLLPLTSLRTELEAARAGRR